MDKYLVPKETVSTQIIWAKQNNNHEGIMAMII